MVMVAVVVVATNMYRIMVLAAVTAIEHRQRVIKIIINQFKIVKQQSNDYQNIQQPNYNNNNQNSDYGNAYQQRNAYFHVANDSPQQQPQVPNTRYQQPESVSYGASTNVQSGYKPNFKSERSSSNSF